MNRIFEYKEHIMLILEAYDVTPVSSSCISNIAYNDRNLYITFNNGSRYEYFNVPNRIAQPMLQAPSKGKHLWKFIRGKFNYHKMDPSDKIPHSTTGVPVGYEIQTKYGTYIWKGAQFVNAKTGRIARREVRDVLTRIAKSQLKTQ